MEWRTIELHVTQIGSLDKVIKYYKKIRKNLGYGYFEREQAFQKCKRK
jgi:hypothetical protein